MGNESFPPNAKAFTGANKAFRGWPKAFTRRTEAFIGGSKSFTRRTKSFTKWKKSFCVRNIRIWKRNETVWNAPQTNKPGQRNLGQENEDKQTISFPIPLPQIPLLNPPSCARGYQSCILATRFYLLALCLAKLYLSAAMSSVTLKVHSDREPNVLAPPSVPKVSPTLTATTNRKTRWLTSNDD